MSLADYEIFNDAIIEIELKAERLSGMFWHCCIIIIMNLSFLKYFLQCMKVWSNSLKGCGDLNSIFKARHKKVLFHTFIHALKHRTFLLIIAVSRGLWKKQINGMVYILHL